MARVCDRCSDGKCFKLNVVFDKEDQTKKSKSRAILNVPMDLCDSCITILLHTFGKMKIAFINEAKGEPHKDK